MGGVARIRRIPRRGATGDIALVLATLLFALQAASPAPDKCTAYADQVTARLAGDRGVALGAARRLNRECRNDFDALFRAGRALSRASGLERGRDKDLRQAASPLLDRASQLRSRHAGAWLEFGLLLRKQGGIQIDAQRAIRRALELAVQYPDSTPPPVLAEINFQRAHYYQVELDRLRWLKDARTLGVRPRRASGRGRSARTTPDPPSSTSGSRRPRRRAE